MSREKDRSNNLNLAVIFIAVVVFFVVLSFLFKTFFLIKESTFDGAHSFNLEVEDRGSANIISFAIASKSISVTRIANGKNIHNLGAYLEAPIDGELVLENSDFNYKNISSSLFKNSFSLGRSLNKLTVLDLLRLALFSRGVSAGSIDSKEISTNVKTEDLDNIAHAFNDPTIEKEGKSIQIVNSTDVFGLGSRLAEFVSNVGGNVILVNSQDSVKNSKIIYYNDLSYTVKRLSKYLQIEAVKANNRPVADITIIIGENSLKNLKF